jgi:nicotinamide-nucleotide adenylyltransferase
MTDTMAARLAPFKKLVPELSTALNTFQASSRRFQVLKTVHAAQSDPVSPSRPSDAESAKTLFILDSSFNPPSTAHLTLARSVLSSSSLPKPHRLLLLFSTQNADKAPSPAPFPHRLTMMTIFAQDLLRSLTSGTSSAEAVPIDIGVTKAPYYTDKSIAIESDGAEWYPSQPRHVHLIGFDTLTRLFAAKYYKDFDPPLSALEPYFSAGHQLRVTLRPDEKYGDVDEQRAYLKNLEDGGLESEGGKREWAKLVELVEPNEEAGVSSTKIRNAASAGEWEVVEGLCTEGVAEWVRSEGLYGAEDEGKA